tara:strand:+ start:40378 stop:41322 length:945 start_codon:yes stop_codon:yes gene_type:complete
MHIALICESNIENKLILNLVCKNLFLRYNNKLNIDLIFTKKEKTEFQSVFFDKKKFEKIIFFELSLSFYKYFKKTEYDKTIEISNSLKSYLISKLIRSKIKISTRKNIKNSIQEYFDKRSVLDPKKISQNLLKKITELNVIDLKPDLKINSRQNNEIVKWIFETSTEQNFSKTNFIFIYYDHYSNNKKDLVSGILKSINNSFKTKVILIINSKNKKEGINIYENLDDKFKKIVLKNFINCSDHIQILLILKSCKLFISNNKSLIHIYKFLSKNSFVEFKNDQKQSFFNTLIRKKESDERKHIKRITNSIEKINS